MSGGPSACGCTMWISWDSIWLLQEAVYLFSQDSEVGATQDECDTHLPPREVRGGLLRRTESYLCEGHPQQDLVWCGPG